MADIGLRAQSEAFRRMRCASRANPRDALLRVNAPGSGAARVNRCSFSSNLIRCFLDRSPPYFGRIEFAISTTLPLYHSTTRLRDCVTGHLFYSDRSEEGIHGALRRAPESKTFGNQSVRQKVDPFRWQ